MEQLNKILAEYVKRLGNDYETAIATGNATPELSFRPALDDFLVQMSGFIDRRLIESLSLVSKENMVVLIGCSAIRTQWESMVM